VFHLFFQKDRLLIGVQIGPLEKNHRLARTAVNCPPRPFWGYFWLNGLKLDSRGTVEVAGGLVGKLCVLARDSTPPQLHPRTPTPSASPFCNVWEPLLLRVECAFPTLWLSHPQWAMRGSQLANSIANTPSRRPLRRHAQRYISTRPAFTLCFASPLARSRSKLHFEHAGQGSPHQHSFGPLLRPIHYSMG
jgi:hypothetical protein